MFADEPAYFAQWNGVRSRGSTLREIPRPRAIEAMKRASSLRWNGPSTLRPTRYR